jgi:hypothetical protein
MIKGTITFKDLFKNHSTMQIVGAAGKTHADVETLKTTLASYSDCHIRGVGCIEKVYYAVAGAGNRDDKAIITVSDPDGKIHRWMIPGFNGTPLQDGEGTYVDPVDMAVIVPALTLFTGVAYSDNRSPVIRTI